MRYTQEEMQLAYDDISRKTKPMGAIFGALVGVIPALALYLFFSVIGGHYLLLLIIPPAVIGFFARFVGRTYKLSHRIPVGLIGAIVHIIGCYIMGGSVIVYALTPVAFGISVIVAKTKLEEVHEWALYQAEIGKLADSEKT